MRLAALLLIVAPFASAQVQIDPEIATEIAKIKAIDNHAHPVLPAPGDTEYDALPVEHMDPYTEPVRMREGSPLAAEASRGLFGNADKRNLIQQKGDAYPAWVLDQLGIETMVANRVALGPGIGPPRFLWVPYDDALLFPLDNRALESNPDRKAFFEDEDRLLVRYLKNCGYAKRPASLAEYLKKIVDPTLQRQKGGGAVAIKFEVAYLRSLDFDDVPRAAAEAAYAGKRPYKELQDYLFRYIAAEAGRLGMAVHLHVAWGSGGYFGVAGTNPLLLESVFNDPRLHGTNFVMLHGGWPFTREITALLTKPNVYTDFSAQTLMNYPRAVAQVLREWMELAPDKVLFGTDAYPYSAELGWEESGWVATHDAREALGLALTGMLKDGEITRDRGFELAHMVLRDNARKLYSLK
ncbi:MAG TPA: amidohydrolase family protein [Bryobacteraceae bacterium]|nr:amidohydrolase family protein [Bryobacteraceae bacterium]